MTGFSKLLVVLTVSLRYSSRSDGLDITMFHHWKDLTSSSILICTRGIFNRVV